MYTIANGIAIITELLGYNDSPLNVIFAHPEKMRHKILKKIDDKEIITASEVRKLLLDHYLFV